MGTGVNSLKLCNQICKRVSWWPGGVMGDVAFWVGWPDSDEQAAVNVVFLIILWDEGQGRSHVSCPGDCGQDLSEKRCTGVVAGNTV
jgi:hypothetical protein